MPVVVVPTAYRGPTRGESEIPVEGATVRACLLAVEAKYAGFLPQVLDAGGRVHRFVKLFINGELISPEALEAPVEADDRVEVLAAIAGG
ncbi:MAG: MoaD/ThiS family protein [Myxococcota bacterium]